MCRVRRAHAARRADRQLARTVLVFAPGCLPRSAGKSTLARKLANVPGVKVFLEPVYVPAPRAVQTRCRALGAKNFGALFGTPAPLPADVRARAAFDPLA